MKLLKKVFLVISFLIPTMVYAANPSIDMSDPIKMVTAVAQNTFDHIKANKDKLNDKKFREQLIVNDLLPYVDTTYAAYKVLGNNLSTLSKEQREKFASVFSSYMVSIFADTLSKYNNQQLVPPAYVKVDPNVSFYDARFIIRDQGKPDIQVVFKLRLNKKTQQWKAYDMVAENISLLSAKQAEISPILKQKGIDYVIALLQNPKSNKLDGKLE